MTITLPLYWTQEYKTKADKTWLVGMNAYRNWHHFTSNKWKTDFHELVKAQIPADSPSFQLFHLDLRIYYKNVCDGSNIAALMEKVVLDTLQKEGILVNDNVKFHLSSTWSVAGQDKTNPRCEITIKEVECKSAQ